MSAKMVKWKNGSYNGEKELLVVGEAGGKKWPNLWHISMFTNPLNFLRWYAPMHTRIKYTDIKGNCFRLHYTRLKYAYQGLLHYNCSLPIQLPQHTKPPWFQFPTHSGWLLWSQRLLWELYRCEIGFQQQLQSSASGITGPDDGKTEEHHDEIACIIYDEYMYFAEAVAKHLKLPSIML